MTDPESPNGRKRDAVAPDGILAALPRTRPQRASPRRAAARVAEKQAQAEDPQPRQSRATGQRSKPAKPKQPKPTRAHARPRPARKPVEPPAPRQGYEPEEEIELGSTVNPPSGAELVESVADIVGELASSGLTAGGRILKDAFTLLRRP